MYRLLRRFIHRFMLRPVAGRILQLKVVGAARLDRNGPAIVVANHNSHVDTAALLAAFPTARIDSVHPMAAADYFLRSRLLAWFSTRIVGILPVDRSRGQGGDPLGGAMQALAGEDILIVYPEGSRGQPGVLGQLRTGVSRLALRNPEVPVIPVWLDGCGEAMPKGARIPRIAACTARVGRPLFVRPGETIPEFTDRIRTALLDGRDKVAAG